MLKNTFLVVLLAISAAGCAGVKAQSYVMTTPRVDIENRSGGNAGYISGKGEYQEPARKTRKVYVLEVTKPIPESEVKKVEEEVQTTTQDIAYKAPAPTRREPEVVREEPRRIVIPRIDDEPASSYVPSTPKVEEIGPSEAQTYKVQKDDTLQKIAKKFYGSYGKWIKIYEANKDKLKNPNFVRPGIELTIPAVEKK